MLILCPDIEVSTAWSYVAWDAACVPGLKGAQRKKPAMQTGLTSFSGKDTKPSYHCASAYDLSAVANDFEDVVFARFPILRQYKESLLQLGAVAAFMSGSGSSLVGIFADDQTALNAGIKFRQNGLRSFRQAL
jgi:4-diphosphocytidyl-2-C-methyl-D-erythritol kinase